MAQHCFDGSECTGCGGCFSEEETACCAECGRVISARDRVVMTERGAVCDDAECIYAAAEKDCSDKDFREYAANFIGEFFEKFHWEIFEAATLKNTPFWIEGNPLREFAAEDKESFVTFWLDSRGYFLQRLSDAL